jgi:hypothetical protein
MVVTYLDVSGFILGLGILLEVMVAVLILVWCQDMPEL